MRFWMQIHNFFGLIVLCYLRELVKKTLYTTLVGKSHIQEFIHSVNAAKAKKRKVEIKRAFVAAKA